MTPSPPPSQVHGIVGSRLPMNTPSFAKFPLQILFKVPMLLKVDSEGLLMISKLLMIPPALLLKILPSPKNPFWILPLLLMVPKLSMMLPSLLLILSLLVMVPKLFMIPSDMLMPLLRMMVPKLFMVPCNVRSFRNSTFCTLKKPLLIIIPPTSLVKLADLMVMALPSSRLISPKLFTMQKDWKVLKLPGLASMVPWLMIIPPTSSALKGLLQTINPKLVMVPVIVRVAPSLILNSSSSASVREPIVVSSEMMTVPWKASAS